MLAATVVLGHKIHLMLISSFITSIARRQSSFLISLNSSMTKQMKASVLLLIGYRAEDDTMQEAGEDFEEDIENCTYNLVEAEPADA